MVFDNELRINENDVIDRRSRLMFPIFLIGACIVISVHEVQVTYKQYYRSDYRLISATNIYSTSISISIAIYSAGLVINIFYPYK
ncbi:unnamed protein product [Oppiella nova]|uniref:Uncharacterized protein n=1 Tax=Oppiella nova TaxID=334625 RepID=A0A7R9QZ62_9ACAR|nr:unnamed protein product [Oppiella nova]CAG2180869.1 unnamed protein product [Oppiella nova]